MPWEFQLACSPCCSQWDDYLVGLPIGKKCTNHRPSEFVVHDRFTTVPMYENLFLSKIDNKLEFPAAFSFWARHRSCSKTPRRPTPSNSTQKKTPSSEGVFSFERSPIDSSNQLMFAGLDCEERTRNFELSIIS